MLALHPEYIIDQKEIKKSVVLPFKEWKSLIEEVEELEDIRAYDKAKENEGRSIPFEQAIKEIRVNPTL